MDAETTQTVEIVGTESVKELQQKLSDAKQQLDKSWKYIQETQSLNSKLAMQNAELNTKLRDSEKQLLQLRNENSFLQESSMIQKEEGGSRIQELEDLNWRLRSELNTKTASMSGMRGVADKIMVQIGDLKRSFSGLEHEVQESFRMDDDSEVNEHKHNTSGTSHVRSENGSDSSTHSRSVHNSRFFTAPSVTSSTTSWPSSWESTKSKSNCPDSPRQSLNISPPSPSMSCRTEFTLGLMSPVKMPRQTKTTFPVSSSRVGYSRFTENTKTKRSFGSILDVNVPQERWGRRKIDSFKSSSAVAGSHNNCDFSSHDFVADLKDLLMDI